MNLFLFSLREKMSRLVTDEGKLIINVKFITPHPASPAGRGDCMFYLDKKYNSIKNIPPAVSSPSHQVKILTLWKRRNIITKIESRIPCRKFTPKCLVAISSPIIFLRSQTKKRENIPVIIRKRLT